MIDAGTDPSSGQRKQLRRSGFRTRAEAEDAMTKALAAVNAGVWTDDQGITVGDWLDQWLAELLERGRSPKTLANYRGHVRDVWKPKLGRLRLRDLRRAHIERTLAELGRPVVAADRAKGNVGRRIGQRTPSTIDGYRRTLRSALSTAQRRGLITMNPAEGRMDAIPDRHDEDDRTVWEPEQTARFLAHVATDRLAALYELAAYAGLRRAELCGLRWSDLDPGVGAGLTIRQTVVEVSLSQLTPAQRICPYCASEHAGRLFKRPKSRAGRRWVPLARPAREALVAHRARQMEERAMFGPDYSDHDLVFCRMDGAPLRPGAVTVAFEGHVIACGLPTVRLHDTRHGACSLMLAGGVPIEVVQMIMGHSSPAVTRKVYAHVMRRATADQVNAATDLLTRLRE
ncbi:tyrosine-type recombinase/integrase [Angustibacter sp. McL0619]|uniref:tyrosine-type recombinase/integrase n=1 Tax=Angustibacter sp. McL0619 TaxID=3415676 RepID=UPI003CF2FE2C